MATNAPTYGSPGLPSPGPTAADSADALPFLAFSPGSSPCQGSVSPAIGGNPGRAGPLPTNPTQQMQDFGQPMGQTLTTPGQPLSGGDPDDI